MIKAILVFNNHGKPRLSKFYQYFNEDMQQQIIKETFQLVSKRDDNVCNFLEGGSLIGGSDYKLIYRHYATLYFVFCVDSSESELGILDLIQVFVETLDKCFENVCELDLIFHADAVHHILSELVMGGMVLQTNMSDILARIEDQNKLVKQEAGLSAAPARAVSAVKSMNIPQQIKDIKLPDLPQAIKDLKFWPSNSTIDSVILNRMSSHNTYLPIEESFNYDCYQAEYTPEIMKQQIHSISQHQQNYQKKSRKSFDERDQYLLDVTSSKSAPLSNNSSGGGQSNAPSKDHQSISGINTILPEHVYNQKYT